MASGLERLEKLFNVSRKRDKTIFGNSPSLDNFVFPSPPYMKPKSMRMTPREEEFFREKPSDYGVQDDRGSRLSQSEADDHLESRSSSNYTRARNTGTLRSSNCSGNSSLSFEYQREPDAVQQLSKFKFPEDSLFRHPPTTHSSSGSDASSRYAHDAESAPKTPEAEPLESGLLDWSPRHISMLLSPLGPPQHGDRLAPTAQDDTAESMILKPSPIMRTSGTTGSRFASSKVPGSSSRRSRQGARLPERKLSLFPKLESSFRVSQPLTYSPPVSDSEDSLQRTSRSFSAADTSVGSVPTTIPEQSTTSVHHGNDNTDKFQRDSPRHTMAAIQSKSALARGDTGSIAVLPRSRLKRTQSAITLSLMASNIAKEHILHEPTLDDIYALSDEDIAEARPSTPSSNPQRPPPLPPKDIPSRNAKKRGTAGLKSHKPPAIAIKPTYGQITPPETPTESLFITPSLPNNSAGALGAIMAAGIAKKYSFDVVYLVSLWPQGPKDSFSSSVQGSIAKHTPSSFSAGTMQLETPSNGRFLAAFGLSDLEEPFKIYTKVHLKILQFTEWLEYEKSEAASETLDRGWMHSFHCQRAPAKQETAECPMNSGLVFAAYRKQKNPLSVPVKGTPERKQFLEDLHADANILVDTLSERPLE
ncbi:hypothetical protein PG993_000543 [Apiospora rasikravindrae]|uniref:Uncharacterized protein n=1 Tax=Apiospora rasikravindrae TaxID=990691 RepID=A0ABR1U8U9_9PEZI